MATLMDTPSTLLRPRLRLFRRSPDGDETPQPARPPFHDDNDDDGDEFPTPRILPKPIANSTAETPAARLRALLAREPRSPRATTPPPAPSSEADSAVGPPRFGSSTSSVARDSLRDIFSRALREPGDTPQKGRPRRNSFDGSSMEITPVVERDRGQRRAARRSLSDEEAEKPSTLPSQIILTFSEHYLPESNQRVDPSFRLSTAITFDTLRERLASSRSQLVDQNPPDALYNRTLSTITSSCTFTMHAFRLIFGIYEHLSFPASYSSYSGVHFNARQSTSQLSHTTPVVSNVIPTGISIQYVFDTEYVVH